MTRVLPPAGTPFVAADVASAISGLFQPHAVLQFEQEIKNVTGASHAIAVNTGRTALTLALLALKQEDARTEVIIPGYTCFTVPSAVKRAGLRARLVDFAQGTMQYDIKQLEKLETSNTLAIILIYPFAMYSDPEPILAWAKSRGIYLIEDVAQGFGLRHSQNMLGTFGDIGIYSFSKGKTITSVRGGFAVSNNDRLASRLQTLREKHCQPPGLAAIMKIMFEAFVLWIFLHPKRFGLITKLPFVKLGETHYDPDFTLARMSSPAASLAIRKTRMLNEINNDRAKRGRNLLARLQDAFLKRKIATVSESASAHSLFLRTVLLANDKLTRDRFLAAGKSLGLSRMYGEPLSVIDDPELWATKEKQSTPVAEDFAHRMFTVPTHAFVSEDEMQEIVRMLSA